MPKMVIIDDEFIVVEGIKALISRERLDYDIVGFAYDGITALEVIREKEPEVVITDIRIPGLDGLSLIEECKEFLPGTAFIVISGYNEFEYARKALSLGVKGYLDKPITIDKIKEVLDRIEKERVIGGRTEKSGGKSDKQEGKSALNSCMDMLIHGILQEEAEEVRKQAVCIMEILKKQNAELEEYKNECYQFLCVAQGVFSEQKRQYEWANIAAYKEMEELKSFEAVNAYVNDSILKIAEKIQVVKSGSSHRTILKLLDFINENYHKDIGLNELADMVNMNPAYLSILFKDEVGMSYIKYLTQVRLNHAKELLLKGLKVTQVSEKVGYNDYHYFCNIFKKNVGMKPNEYKGCIRKK